MASSVPEQTNLWISQFEARHRDLARAEARRWEPARVAEQFEVFFRAFSPE
jgi:hypothetical protein